jgi:thiamine biosynthesis lipoprotein
LSIAVIVASMWFTDSRSVYSDERFSFSEPHLGTIVELTIYAPNETAANEAARAAFRRIKELDLIFSDYKSDSEAMRLCEQAGTGKAVKVSPELFTVLKKAIAVSEQTDGAFDVTVGPLVNLWRRARNQKKLPSDEELQRAKELVDWKSVQLNESQQTVELKRPGMRLDFGGIAKGFIAQDVSRLLCDRGLRQTLVAVAGDIVAGDSPPVAHAWKVAVAPLGSSRQATQRLLELKNCAVSTSGDAFQFVEIEGVRYSHIVDPKTGIGLTNRRSATVVAPDGTTADALATAICVLGPENGLKLIDPINDVDCLIAVAADDGVRVVESKSFAKRDLK